MSATDGQILLGRRWAEAEQREDVAALDALSTADLTPVGRLGRFRATHVAVRHADEWLLSGLHLSPRCPCRAAGVGMRAPCRR